MLTVLILLLYLLTILLDFLPVRKERQKKENFIYCALLLASFAVLLLYTFDIKIPGPSDAIRRAVEGVLGPAS